VGPPGTDACRAAGLTSALLAALTIAGCATPPGSPDKTSVSGRLSIQVDTSPGLPANRFTAAFDLSGTAEQGQLQLNSPLGVTMASARWGSGEALLVTPHGERRFPDLEALSRESLGENLPLRALPDWLKGRPWPGAASTPQAAATGFDQLGWTVDLSRFAAGAVSATRLEPQPPVGVRIQLDGS